MRNNLLFHEENLPIICHQRKFDILSIAEQKSEKILRNNAYNL